jgi:hypothetical protein
MNSRWCSLLEKTLALAMDFFIYGQKWCILTCPYEAYVWIQFKIWSLVLPPVSLDVFVFSVRPKPKPKLVDTFGQYHNRYRNQISTGKSSYIPIVLGIFSIIKEPLKSNLQPNFQDFKITFEDLCSISSFLKFVFP